MDAILIPKLKSLAESCYYGEENRSGCEQVAAEKAGKCLSLDGCNKEKLT